MPVSVEALNSLGVVSILVLVSLAVITDKLVWHTRLKAAQNRADRWEEIAIEALRFGAQAGVKAAEVTADVVSALPDPERDHQSPEE